MSAMTCCPYVEDEYVLGLREGDGVNEQPIPVPGRAAVTETLIGWLREREAKGIATYGRSLETFNGRSAPLDLKEELIDALQYAMQWEMERDQLRADLVAARALLREIYDFDDGLDESDVRQGLVNPPTVSSFSLARLGGKVTHATQGRAVSYLGAIAMLIGLWLLIGLVGIITIIRELWRAFALEEERE